MAYEHTRRLRPGSLQKNAPLAATVMVHLQEPTFNNRGTANGRNMLWMLTGFPSPADLENFFYHDASLSQGTTLSAYSISNGHHLAWVYVKRNTNGLPIWKKLAPPTNVKLPSTVAPTLSGQFSHQWKVPPPNPAWGA